MQIKPSNSSEKVRPQNSDTGTGSVCKTYSSGARITTRLNIDNNSKGNNSSEESSESSYVSDASVYSPEEPAKKPASADTVTKTIFK